MIAIRNYGDTKNELEIAQSRLDVLETKQQRLFNKYFPTTTFIKDILIQPVNKDNDNNMINYLTELDKIDKKTNMSLRDEILHQTAIINTLKPIINLMEHNLKKMKGIEYKLYYAIVVEGRGITGGIDHVSYEVNKDVSTIWRVYYPKIEKEIKKLEIV